MKSEALKQKSVMGPTQLNCHFSADRKLIEKPFPAPYRDAV